MYLTTLASAAVLLLYVTPSLGFACCEVVSLPQRR